MKKIVWLNRLLFVLFVMATVLVFVANTSNVVLYGYLLFLFLYVFYLLVLFFFYWKKAGKAEIRTRAIIFIKWFMILTLVSFLLNLFIRPDYLETMQFIWTPLGCSLGIAFLDIAFVKENKS